MRNLILYTDLPLVWKIFQNIVTISPVTEQGYTLTGAQAYLSGLEGLQLTHDEFWNAMTYFLSRLNEKFIMKLKMKRRSGNG